jgi:anti-sigma B factor antagonist
LSGAHLVRGREDMAVARFEVTTSAQPGSVVVTLSGEADLEVRDELTETLLTAVTRAPLVVVDLDGVDFMDSSGVHALVAAYRAAKADGTRLYAVNAHGIVGDLLDLTGIAGLLHRPSGDGGPLAPDGGERGTR